MSLRKKRFRAAMVFGLILLSTAGARAGDEVPVGPRAIAMGGAFSAVADDISALFWNPAGLSQVGRQELIATRANLFNTGIVDNYVAGLFPLSSGQALSIGWYHSGFGDPELDFGENRFDFGYGFRMTRWLSAGATAKYLTRDTSLDGTTVRSGRGAGMDLGLLTHPLPRLRMALVVQDVFNTRLTYSSGNGSADAYPRKIRFGSAYAPSNRTLLTVDLDDRYHIGAEFAPVEILALRAGLQKDFSGDLGTTWSAGAGFKIDILKLDYAYEIHPELDATSHFGIGVAFNLNPSEIRIEKVKAEEIFTSLYKSYSAQSFGTATVQNLRDESLTARFSISIEGLTKLPTVIEETLAKKARMEIPLTLVLDREVLREAGAKPAQITVTASYRSHRLERTDKGRGQTYVHGRGAIDWGRGVEQAAAFVTMRDPVVDAVARSAAGLVSESNPFGVRNVSRAAAVFDALTVLGVHYVPDPVNSYADISKARGVDTIHYPRETLQRQAGDCDDTVVLLASLLGNIGIATRIVDGPGHVFLLVDTGLTTNNAEALGVSEARYVVDEGMVWIPVETTAIARGFATAWEEGAGRYQGWQSQGQMSLVDVSTAQQRYEPADLGEPDFSLTLPDASIVAGKIDEDAARFSAWRKDFMSQLSGEISPDRGKAAAGRNAVARVYFRAGRWDAARRELETEPISPAARNNLGVIALASGSPGEAVTHLEAAVAASPDDAGCRLNLALARHSAGDLSGRDESLSQGIRLAGGFEEACRILGVSLSSERGLPALIAWLQTYGSADKSLTSHLYWKSEVAR